LSRVVQTYNISSTNTANCTYFLVTEVEEILVACQTLVYWGEGARVRWSNVWSVDAEEIAVHADSAH